MEILSVTQVRRVSIVVDLSFTEHYQSLFQAPVFVGLLATAIPLREDLVRSTLAVLPANRIIGCLVSFIILMRWSAWLRRWWLKKRKVGIYLSHPQHYHALRLRAG